MEKKHLVLASGSPRRKELLSQLGYEFSVLVTDVLGDKRQSPLASVDGCETVGLHLESFHHDRARQRQPALASPRPTPGDAPTRCAPQN